MKKLVASDMPLAANRRRGQKSIVYCDGIKSPRSGGTKPKPSGAGSVWKGGARKRADDVFFCRRHKKTSEQSELCSDVVEEGGFEPPKRNATDLQSAPFGHSGTPPYEIVGAGGRIRTPDLLITNQLLYQLSYTSSSNSRIYLTR